MSDPPEVAKKKSSVTKPVTDVEVTHNMITTLAKEEFKYTRQLKTLLRNYIEMLQNHIPRDLRDSLKALLSACSNFHTKISARLEFRKARKVTPPNKIGQLFIDERKDFNLIYPALTAKILQLRAFINSEAYPSIRRKIEELDMKSPLAPVKFDRLLDYPLERVNEYISFLYRLGEANKAHLQILDLGRDALIEINDNLLRIRDDHSQLETVVSYENSISGLPIQKKNVLIEYGRLIRSEKVNFRFGPESEGQERLCLLFDFILVICAPLGNNNYSYRGCLIVNDIEATSTMPGSNQTVLSETKNIYLKHHLCQCTHVMSLSSENEKALWLSALERAKDNGNPAPVRTGTVKHGLVLRTFSLNTLCDHCYKVLLGFIYQGYQCFKCGLIIHKECMTHESLAKCRIPADKK